jgi:hypothetical protein
MAKTAKRTTPVASPDKLGTLRSLPARRDLAASGVIEGRVGSVDEHGTVRAVLNGGEPIEARCPAHIDLAWLKAASACAPVDAAFVVARPSGRHILWGVFPGAAHAEVRADVVIRGRQVRLDAESVHLSSRDAHLRLEADGNVAVKGRDVTSHARRVNRIKGGSIRLN